MSKSWKMEGCVVRVGVYTLSWKMCKGVRTPWWRELGEQNPGDVQKAWIVVHLCGWL